ncbi:MAG: hypothetical protein ACREDF_07735, partial [Thermoplasmata archaeon]
MTPAVREALRRGEKVFPFLNVEWRARGKDLGEAIYAPGGTVMAAAVPALGKVPLGGFSAINYGSGIKGGTLQVARGTVKVEDVDQVIASMLETYDPRGSVARICWATADMLPADWDVKLLGVIEDWIIVDRVVELLVKTDDAPLRAPCPKPIFSRSDDPTAVEAAIYGTAHALVFGEHDSFKVTARGMVPATNIAYDDVLGFKWEVSLGNFGVDRVYFDGELKEPGIYSIATGVFGGVYRTIVDVATESKPEKGTIVSVDGRGPDEDGGLSGPPITNPIRIARVILNEYVYRDNRTGNFGADVPEIDTATWDAIEAYFALHGYRGSLRIGGEGDRPEAYKVLESLLSAHQFLRLWWTPAGKIAIGIVSYEDVDPTGTWVRADLTTSAKDFRYLPGDRREVYSG